jgi:DNA invertase Pin-like site-specific DNA recombinase
MKATEANPKYVAYYRVSSSKQGIEGLGMTAQRTAVKSYIGRKPDAEYEEVESGKKSKRPQLALAIERAKKDKATLVIAKLDRLARNVHFVTGLQESKVKFVAVDCPDANELTIHILAAVAQAERKAIAARTKAALASLKGKKKLGAHITYTKDTEDGEYAALTEGERRALRQRDADKARSKRKAKAIEFAKALEPRLRDFRQLGFTSHSALARKLNEYDIEAPRGGRWTAQQVKQLPSLA